MDRDSESPNPSSPSSQPPPKADPSKGLAKASTPGPRGEGTRVLGAGMTFAASMVVFALGGYWLDGQFGSQPWLTLVGCLFGLVGGTIHLLNAVAPGTLPFGKNRPSDQPREPDPDSESKNDTDT